MKLAPPPVLALPKGVELAPVEPLKQTTPSLADTIASYRNHRPSFHADEGWVGPTLSNYLSTQANIKPKIQDDDQIQEQQIEQPPARNRFRSYTVDTVPKPVQLNNEQLSQDLENGVTNTLVVKSPSSDESEWKFKPMSNPPKPSKLSSPQDSMNARRDNNSAPMNNERSEDEKRLDVARDNFIEAQRPKSSTTGVPTYKVGLPSIKKLQEDKPPDSSPREIPQRSPGYIDELPSNQIKKLASPRNEKPVLLREPMKPTREPPLPPKDEKPSIPLREPIKTIKEEKVPPPIPQRQDKPQPVVPAPIPQNTQLIKPVSIMGRPKSMQYNTPPVNEEQNAQINAQIIKPISILNSRPKSNQYAPAEVQSSFYNQDQNHTIVEKVNSKGIPLLTQIRQEPVMRTRPRGISDAEPLVDITATPVILTAPHIEPPTIPVIPPRSPKKPTDVVKLNEDKLKKEKQEQKRDNVKENLVSPRVKPQDKTEEKKENIENNVKSPREKTQNIEKKLPKEDSKSSDKNKKEHRTHKTHKKDSKKEKKHEHNNTTEKVTNEKKLKTVERNDENKEKKRKKRKKRK